MKKKREGRVKKEGKEGRRQDSSWLVFDAILVVWPFSEPFACGGVAISEPFACGSRCGHF